MKHLNLQKLAEATGGVIVKADSSSHEDEVAVMDELKRVLSGWFSNLKADYSEKRRMYEVVGSSDRIHFNIIKSSKGLEVAASSVEMPGRNKISIYFKYTKISKSDFGDLTDALIKAHELVSSFVSVSSIG